MKGDSAMRRFIATALIALAGGAWAAPAQEVQLPDSAGSVKFAVIGDNGTGGAPQYEVGRQMSVVRARFPFDFVIMLGDNMYGRQQPQDFVDKFERPYAALLQSGVPFYATLGNHDSQTNRFYKGFNMGGERYYTFVRKNVRFFVFDSNLMDAKQLAWIDETLEQSGDDWKICYFHHPLYSDAGRHGSDVELRVILEPLLVRHRVDVVFSGHEHVYERTRPQQGITYFIDGSSGQLRKGDVIASPTTAAAFDQDQTFMLVEVGANDMFFQAISRTGRVVDSGVIHKRKTTITGSQP
jgi:3',5'-cyclic AMP phosphodiesterase CpdA